MSRRGQVFLIQLALMAAVAAIYARVGNYDFIVCDDRGYVSENPLVSRGLSTDGVAWAFTTRQQGHWQPVTWIANMLTCELFGLDAGAHHMVNVLLHAANALLLFGLLVRMTGSVPRSGFVAALFAVHPLHVESVAWIAERKDVLSTLFWMLTVHAYVGYVRRGGAGRCALALAAYALGLMAKPMIVTLPVILVLLDVWPLGRLGAEAGGPGATLRRQVLEKAPFLALAAVSSAITYFTTALSGALSPHPLGLRLSNAVWAYGAYLGKMIWPDALAYFYPLVAAPPPALVAVSAAALVAVSAIAIRLRKACPCLLVGWLWYLVMLLPVIGIVHAGAQSMADRYTYLPLVGIYLAIAWGVSAAAGRSAARVLPAAAIAVIVALGVRAWGQVSVWQDGVTVARHAVRVAGGSHEQYNNLGIALADRGRYEEAIASYREGLKLRPSFAWTHNNLGNALMQSGALADAVASFEEALRLKPDYPEARNNLGVALARQGDYDAAIVHLLAALKDRPGSIGRQRNFLRAAEELRGTGQAAGYYREALAVAESAGEKDFVGVLREKLE